MPQTQTGTTINAVVSLNAVTGAFIFTLNDPFNMLVNLKNSSGIINIGSSFNDKFVLANSTGVTINGGNGNNIYNISAAAASLNGNMIHGGRAIDFVTLSGSGSVIDLTQGGQSGIEAVVGGKRLSGQSLTLSLAQLSGSALTDGGSGRAFAAVLGTDATINLVQTGKFKFVGVVDAAGNGFDAAGAAISGDALSTLKASVTQISSISGNLAALFGGSPTGTVPAKETEVSKALGAYVFSDGTKAYTVWTDGHVSTQNGKGDLIADLYQPAAANPTAPYVYSSVAMFNNADTWAGANIFADANGVQHIQLLPGNTEAASAVVLRSGVTGTDIHGDTGKFGVSYFGLGGSGGGNHIFGSKAGNVFDLSLSTALQDQLTGSTGFDVVKAGADGADVDLTASNATTSKAATSIEAVVGSNVLSHIQTVELDVSSLRYAVDPSGAKSAVFEAMLGSADDTLTLSGKGLWVEIGTFAPGSELPAHAAALQHADDLNALFGLSRHTAETSLVGHLFEQVDLKGNALKYLTVYTDATLQVDLSAPLHPLAAHGDFLI